MLCVPVLAVVIVEEELMFTKPVTGRLERKDQYHGTRDAPTTPVLLSREDYLVHFQVTPHAHTHTLTSDSQKEKNALQGDRTLDHWIKSPALLPTELAGRLVQ